MKIFIRLNITILILFISSILFAQKKPDENSWQNYIQKQDKYWEQRNTQKSVLKSTNEIDEKEYIDYLKWKSYVERRLGDDGNLTDYINYKNNYDIFNSSNLKTTGSDIEANWEFVGPIGVPPTPGNGSKGSTGKGQMVSIYVDPNNTNHIISGAHHGGLWETYNRGDNWICLTDNEPLIDGVKCFAVDQNDPNIIYLATRYDQGTQHLYSNGIFKTNDGGVTWDQIVLYLDNEPIYPNGGYPFWTFQARKLKIHPENTNIIFYVTHSYIFKSEDYGLNWQVVYNNDFTGSGLLDFEFDADDNSIIYVSGEIILKSENGGELNSWTDVTYDITGEYSFYNSRISVNINYPGKLWYIYDKDDNDYVTLGVYNRLNSTSTPLGGTYTQNHFNKLCFEVSPNDENVAYIFGTGYKKYDNGNFEYISNTTNPSLPSWIHVDGRDMLVLDINNEDEIYLAHDGGISIGNYDNGNCIDSYDEWCWEDISDDGTNGLNITEFYGFGMTEIEPNLMIGGTQDCCGFVYDNGNWYHTSWGDDMDAIIDYEDPNYIYLTVGASNLYKSSDRGINFGTFIFESGGEIFRPVVLDPINPKILYYGIKDLKRYELDDNRIIINNNLILTVSNDLTSIAIPKSNSNTIYVGTDKAYWYWSEDINGQSPPQRYDGCLLKTQDGGLSWDDIGYNLPGCYYGFVTDIEVNPYNSNELWVSFARVSQWSEKVYYSDNGGQTWSEFSQGLPEIDNKNIPVWVIKYDYVNEALYAGTDWGVYYRDMTFNEWVPYYDCNLVNKIVNDMELNFTESKIVAATFGRGVWQSPLYFCPSQSNVNITGTKDANYFEEASQKITSSANNLSGIKAKYAAGEEIELLPGFISSNNFLAYIPDRSSCEDCEYDLKTTRINSYIKSPENFKQVVDSLKANPLVNNNIIVYPNPNNGNFRIIIEDEISQNTSLIIFNEAGKIFYNNNELMDNEKELLLNLKPNLYFIAFINGEEIYYQKFIVSQ